MAAACLHLMENYDGPSQVNVGTGSDVTIRELATVVADAVGYQGAIEWDTSKPDGTPRKLLDVSRLAQAGWTASIGLEDGIRSTVKWYRDNLTSLRN
jgi:GDP-L-fucose synthase